jgi:L-asparagine transporter-like permease
VRATYGLIQIIAIGAASHSCGVYMAFWFPAVPAWVWVTAASVGLASINSFHVGWFGEFEYWFAFIKVLAIIIFILSVRCLSSVSPQRGRSGSGILSRTVVLCLTAGRHLACAHSRDH